MEQNTPQKIEITLEDVLNVTQKGFERMDKRFEEIEEKMATKEELNAMELRLTEKIDKVDSRLGGLTRRVDALEDSNRIIKTNLAI